MDEYTAKTKLWLDERFRKVDEYGVYWAHQPVYGFRAGHSEPALFDKYIRTYEIMKSLSHIEFNTLLDVGGAEGYKAYIVQELFNAKVISSDLSVEACKRANEIFNIASVVADIHELPFNNDEFDIVLCSETLEHVKNFDKAVSELLRIAKKAVVITVPHEPKEVIERNIKNEEIHGHIHAFNSKTFNFMKSDGYNVITKKIASHFLTDIANKIIDKELTFQNTETGGLLRKGLSSIYNMCVLIANKILNKRMASLIMSLDSFISYFMASYHAVLFVIQKDKECFRKKNMTNVSAYQIVNFKCPLHYLKTEETINIICGDQDESAFLTKMVLASKKEKAFFAQKLETISFFIDKFKINKDSFEMVGWAHINGKDSENSHVYIVLQSSKRTYVCSAITRYRPDVTAFFNNLNLDNSGFCIRAATDNLEKGKYQIGLYLEKDCCDKGFQFTNKHLVL